MNSQEKSPLVALLLSFLISGLGQIYNGSTSKGIIMVVVYVVCWASGALVIPLIVLFILWVWGMVDAYSEANTINESLVNKIRIEEEEKEEALKQEALRQAQEQAKRQKEISPTEFISMIDKSWRLFQGELISEAEFSERKKQAIGLLIEKSLSVESEEMLLALLPLKEAKKLSSEEIQQIKSLIL
jgi:TM2 domain-containing membrane protein YozV